MDNRFLLTSATVDGPVDIIYCGNDRTFEFVKDNLRREARSFMRISEEDATKLLIASGNIGCGCYISDPTGRTNDFRYSMAASKWNHLNKRFGFIVHQEPIELDQDHEFTKLAIEHRVHEHKLEYASN